MQNCTDIAFCRTGKTAKFLLCNHVILYTAHSIVDKASLQSVCYRSIAASSLGSEKRCRLNAARPVHGST